MQSKSSNQTMIRVMPKTREKIDRLKAQHARSTATQIVDAAVDSLLAMPLSRRNAAITGEVAKIQSKTNRTRAA